MYTYYFILLLCTLQNKHENDPKGMRSFFFIGYFIVQICYGQDINSNVLNPYFLSLSF